MKKAKIISSLILLSVFMISCSSVPQQNQNIEREWMMVSFENFSKTELMNSSAKIIFKKESDFKFKADAKMGCNTIFFTAETKNSGKIVASNPVSTEMLCKSMTIEDAFLKILPKIKTFKVEGHFLTLMDNEGNAIKFVAADWD